MCYVKFLFVSHVFSLWITCYNFGFNLHTCFLICFGCDFSNFLTMAPLKPHVGFKFHHFFFCNCNVSSSNLTSRDVPCLFTSRNGNPFTLNTSFANLPPNTFEPPSTIVTSITSLSFKGKCFMVDELATIDIVEVLNGLVVTQPKKKRKVKWEINWVY